MERNKDVVSVGRFEGLADAIFAFAMTLLAISIDLPGETYKGSIGELHGYIFSQGKEVINYAVSFILLANFWIIHHQTYHLLYKIDRKHLWINFFLLLFIVLFPFSSSLIGDFPDDWLTLTLFGLNMFFVGMLFFLSWYYAVCHGFIKKGVDKREIREAGRKFLVTPVVAVISIVGAFFVPGLSLYIYLFIPFVLFFPKISKT